MIQEYEVSISLDRWRGCHNSLVDFPLLSGQTAQYPTDCCTDIILHFANKTFMFPGMVLHYINDVASIGWSWVPPLDFINCLQMGHDPQYNGDKDVVHAVGYLNKKSNEYYDGETPAQVSAANVMDEDVLGLLERIVAFVDAHDELEKNSREVFSSKAPERRASFGGGSRK